MAFVDQEPPAPGAWRRVDSLDAVTALDWRHQQAALWARHLPADVLASCRRLTEGQAFTVTRTLDLRRDAPAALVDRIPTLRAWLSEVPLVGDELARAQIGADLVALTAAMEAITGRSHQRVRLAVVVDHDECAKFHVDQVPVRAVCTYVGAATEYLEEAGVDRCALALAAQEGWPPARANRAVVRDDRALVRPQAGQVLWLRGAAFAGAVGPAAVHRSPSPGPGALGKRLVLTVDVLPADAGRSIES